MLPIKRPWTKKPSKPSAIDWTNPLTRGLKHAFLHQQDLVGKPLGSFDGATFERNQYSSDSTTDQVLFGDSPIGTGDNPTIACSFKPANDTANHFICGNGNHNGSVDYSGFGLRQNGSTIELDVGSSGSNWTFSFYSSAITVGTRMDMVATFETAGSNRRFYLNKVLQTEDGSDGSGTPDNASDTPAIGLFGNDGDGSLSGNARCQGEIDYAFVWDRLLSEEEVIAFNKNPYQLLKPRTLWAPLEAAVAGITGAAASTNADDTQAAAGTLEASGSAASTNANDTQAAAGELTNSGAAASTNADDTQAASGTLEASGSAASTNADDTQVATGTVTTPGITGSATSTNADDTQAAAGQLTASGAASSTNASDIQTASGIVGTIISEPGRIFKASLPLRTFKAAQPLRTFKTSLPLRTFKAAL